MPVVKTQRIDAPSPFAISAPSKVGPVHARLYHIASQILDPVVARSELRKVAMAETGAIAAVHVSRTTDSHWVFEPAQTTGDLPRDEGMREQLIELCTAAAERGKPQIQQSKTAASLFLIGAPIVLPRTADVLSSTLRTLWALIFTNTSRMSGSILAGGLSASPS
jgi:hypothetical protein